MYPNRLLNCRLLDQSVVDGHPVLVSVWHGDQTLRWAMSLPAAHAQCPITVEEFPVGFFLTINLILLVISFGNIRNTNKEGSLLQIL